MGPPEEMAKETVLSHCAWTKGLGRTPLSSPAISWSLIQCLVDLIRRSGSVGLQDHSIHVSEPTPGVPSSNEYLSPPLPNIKTAYCLMIISYKAWWGWTDGEQGGASPAKMHFNALLQRLQTWGCFVPGYRIIQFTGLSWLALVGIYVWWVYWRKEGRKCYESLMFCFRLMGGT